jgi:Uma2 family endonuclease
MMPSPLQDHMSYAEYVTFEERSDVRHEYLRGEVFAMAGGTPQHGALALAFGAELRAALRDRPCVVYNSDVRVRIPETDLTTYPDLSVVCGGLEVDATDRNAILNPLVVVEVLSPTTEVYDRGAKARHYRRITSLREYVLVAQDEPRIEVYQRNAAGRWELLEARSGEQIEIASLGVTLSVDAIYGDLLREPSDATGP